VDAPPATNTCANRTGFYRNSARRTERTMFKVSGQWVFRRSSRVALITHPRVLGARVVREAGRRRAA